MCVFVCVEQERERERNWCRKKQAAEKSNKNKKTRAPLKKEEKRDRLKGTHFYTSTLLHDSNTCDLHCSITICVSIRTYKSNYERHANHHHDLESNLTPRASARFIH